MSVAVLQATPATTLPTGAAYYMQAARAAVLTTWSRTADLPAWTREAWMQALGLSGLPMAAVHSLLIMLDAADQSGNVNLTRETIAEGLGLSRVASVSAHWKQARAAQLMVSTVRFNRPMLHRLTIPGGDLTPPTPHGQPLQVLTWAEASGTQHIGTDSLASAAPGSRVGEPRLPMETP